MPLLGSLDWKAFSSYLRKALTKPAKKPENAGKRSTSSLQEVHGPAIDLNLID